MITLYDIPSKIGKAWSPNVWKARYSLNYKGLPYRTEWIEYPNIARLYHTNNIPPAEVRPGSKSYSLPVIRDDTSGTPVYIAESFEIAKYLDKTYPDTPRLLPEGGDALQKQATFPDEMLVEILGMKGLALTCYDTLLNLLNEASHEHFNRTKGEGFAPLFNGTSPLDQVKFSDKERQEIWDGFKARLSELAVRFGGNEGFSWYEGDQISFADFVVAACILWVKVIYGEESKVWGEVKSWDNGKWETLLQRLSEYQQEA